MSQSNQVTLTVVKADGTTETRYMSAQYLVMARPLTAAETAVYATANAYVEFITRPGGYFNPSSYYVTQTAATISTESEEMVTLTRTSDSATVYVADAHLAAECLVASGTGSEILFERGGQYQSLIVDENPAAIDTLRENLKNAAAIPPVLPVDNISEATPGAGVTFDDQIIHTEPEQLSVGTGITAFATGGQANATQLVEGFNNVTVVATAADSVKLPAAVVGLTVEVKNNGANPLDLFPATGDAIDAAGVDTAISVPTNAKVRLTCIDATTWESDMETQVGDNVYVDTVTEKTAAAGITFTNQIIHSEPEQLSVATGITAFATGGQANATQLTEGFNDVTVVATAADSVKLPAAVAGLAVWVKNSAANSLALFPGTGDSINAIAVDTAINIPGGAQSLFICKDATVWEGGEIVAVDNGAVGAPAFTFRNQPDMGIYYVSATQMGFAVSGALSAMVDNNGLVTGTISEQVVAAGVTIDGARLKDGDLGISDSNDSHFLVLTTTSDLTADRNLTFVTGDAARTFTINGDVTLNDWFDQSVKTTASPTFVAVTTDTINESTPGAGVSPDGVLLKDGDVTVNTAILGLGSTAQIDLLDSAGDAYIDITTDNGVYATTYASINEATGVDFGIYAKEFRILGSALAEKFVANDSGIEANALISILAVGTPGTGVTATHYGDGRNFTTVLSISGQAVTGPAGAAAEAMGHLMYTFPAGAHLHEFSYMSLGLQGGGVVNADTPDVGIGSVVGSGANALLSAVGATSEDYITGQTAANCTGTQTVKANEAVAGYGQGISNNAAGDVKAVYFNYADTWAGADTLTLTGTLVLKWTKMA